MNVSDIQTKLHEGISLAASKGKKVAKVCDEMGKTLRDLFDKLVTSAFKSFQKNDFSMIRGVLGEAQADLKGIQAKKLEEMGKDKDNKDVVEERVKTQIATLTSTGG